MKHHKIWLILIFIFSLTAQSVWADAVAGDRIVTLGADLSEKAKKDILMEFSYSDQDHLIEVTHTDEIAALRGLVPEAVIGTKAISSTRLTFLEAGKGIHVKTHNITWVSEDMYRNALLTAGIGNIDVEITAPFPVSGTAALTGITKAFEVATGESLGEERKKTANREMVETGKIGEAIGDKTLAAGFISQLKEEVQKNAPQTDEEYRLIVEALMNQMGVQLTEEQIQSLISLLKEISSMNVDWVQVSSQIEDLRDQVNEYMKNNPEQANAIMQFLNQVWLAVKELMGKLFA